MDLLHASQSRSILLTQFIKQHDGSVCVEGKAGFLNRAFGRCTGGFVKGADEDCPDDRENNCREQPFLARSGFLGRMDPVAIDGFVRALARVVLIARHNNRIEGRNIGINEGIKFYWIVVSYYFFYNAVVTITLVLAR